MTKVLVIDEDTRIRRFLRACFELQDYTVFEAANATIGLKSTVIDKPDLIILEPNLPDLDGSEVLERVRSWSSIPIIVLSDRSQEQEKVRLLRLGADDYVVKPFGFLELLARCEAASRQYSRANNNNLVQAGPLSIDLVTRVVLLAEKRVQLTRKEYTLLHTLAFHEGLFLTHRQLIKEIWASRGGNIQYLRVLVRKLRQKIETDPARPKLIINKSGIGYRLDTKTSPRQPSERLVSSNRCLF
jgi:two-component system, OmpR family, KDP operon response regulator KdpE